MTGYRLTSSFLFVSRPHTLNSTSVSKAYQSTFTGELNTPYSKQFVHSKSSQYRRLKTEWKNNAEVYSNTGGQASKSTPIGAQAQFAYSGKSTRKKNLGLMMSTYGHVYVAQIAMGSNKAHALKVMQEAEAFPGPSLIIAYSPCIAHGLKGGLTNAQAEEKLAVDSGYWHLWRYNPILAHEGKNPFIMDSKEPNFELFQQFIGHEVRFTALNRQFPERAKELYDRAEKEAKSLYKQYKRLAAMDYSE